MKSLELLPTAENIKSTYCRNTIGRNGDLYRFVEILDAVDDCCVIALDGGWGSGKTFFVKQAKMILDASNPYVTIYERDDDKVIMTTWNRDHRGYPAAISPQISVYFDAWENDNDDDPLLSIVYEILKSVKTDYSFKANINLGKLAAGIFELLTGRKAQPLIDALKQEDPFSSIQSGRDIRGSVNEFFNSLLPEQGGRLVIFIDELDRCKPSFAVRLLERIKHYFSNGNITFVLSINTHELQNTVRQYYGSSFDAYRYLDRFFDLRISLPPADMQKYFQHLGFSESDNVCNIVAYEVIRRYHLELREIAKYLRLIKIATYAPMRDAGSNFLASGGLGLQFCLFIIAPIMIGLKMKDSVQYKAFVEGTDSSPLIKIMGGGEIDCGMLSALLSNNETFDQETGKTKVDLSKKLQAVYEALFVNDNNVRACNVGRLSFDGSTKRVLLQTEGLLSRYADYSDKA